MINDAAAAADDDKYQTRVTLAKVDAQVLTNQPF